MSRKKAACLNGIIILIALAAIARAQTSLRLEKTIPLPNLAGRIDHLAFDVENQRLFVAALGNNTVEVVDIKSNKVARTITGLAEPQGVLYQPEKKRLWIANGADGTVRIFDAQTLKPVRSIELGDDADNIRRDAATQHIYVGYGGVQLAVFCAWGSTTADNN